MWLKLKILYFYLVFRFLHRFKSREELLRWQEKKLLQHLERLRKKSLYLDRHLNQVSSWHELPLMNKNLMMENFDDLNTVGIKKQEAFRVAIQAEETRDFSSMIGDITVGLSSGTSGNRGLFLASPHERAQHAGAILAKILPGSLFRSWKVAFFLRANSNLYSTSQSRFLQFSYFDLLEDLQQHQERLNLLQPDLIIGPPSLLRRLAKLQDEGTLKISPLKVVSVAEVLDPLDCEKIGKSFGQIVHQVYQCTEGFLAITCKKGTLHLNEDIVHVEKHWLDSSKNKFHPIITDFTRSSQPIVRYLLNDILTLKKDSCDCGSLFTALESIEGRADDCLEFFPMSKKGSPGTIEVYPDFIRRCILFATSQISEYHVTQEAVGLLSIALKVSPGADVTSIQEKITRQFIQLAGSLEFQAPEIRFHSEFPELGLKKLRRIEKRIGVA